MPDQPQEKVEIAYVAIRPPLDPGGRSSIQATDRIGAESKHGRMVGYEPYVPLARAESAEQRLAEVGEATRKFNAEQCQCDLGDPLNEASPPCFICHYTDEILATLADDHSVSTPCNRCGSVACGEQKDAELDLLDTSVPEGASTSTTQGGDADVRTPANSSSRGRRGSTSRRHVTEAASEGSGAASPNSTVSLTGEQLEFLKRWIENSLDGLKPPFLEAEGQKWLGLLNALRAAEPASTSLSEETE